MNLFMSGSQASKAAALNFYDTLRMELGGDIRITEVVPGVVESELTKGKILTKEGEMKVDQDERDVWLISLNALLIRCG